MTNLLNQTAPRLPKRVRNELRFRQIFVARKTRVAECFWRIDFVGDDLAGFNSPGFDDHIKLFFPDAASGELHLPQITEDGIVWKEGVRPVSRDYTPLWFDGEKRTLTLDFFIHDGGVASEWAQRAEPGDALAVGGPRGSLLVPEDYSFQLYVCDESGLPAFKRRQQHLTGQPHLLFAFAEPGQGEAYLSGESQVEAYWLGSGEMSVDSAKLDALIARLDSVALPEGDYFIWLTGEGEAVKRLSDYFIEQRGCNPELVRAVAYWHRK